MSKEANRYGEMEIFYEPRKDEIDSLDLDGGGLKKLLEGKTS